MSTSSYWGSSTPDYGGWWRIYDPTKKPAAAAAPAPAPVQAPIQTSIATGIDPSAVANALYGKVIPLSAMGLERIGTAGLIYGPYWSGDVNAGTRVASFAVSFGFPANVDGVRRVYEVALDGKVAWELAGGSPAGALDPSGFLGAAFECRFYGGTMTQGADPLEVAMFGAQSVAYRPQMCLWFSNLPVTAFDNKCPFVSAKIGDVTDGANPPDGINLGTALTMVANSPWLEFDSSTFQTEGIEDIVQAMILTEDQTFLDLLQTTARVYRTFDILQTDMLRVKDRGSAVTPDVVLHRDHIVAAGGVEYLRAEESSVPRELELMTIDPDADYMFIPSKAARPRTPVPVTSSVRKDSITLPVAIDAPTRASLVTFAKYQEDNARKKVAFQTMLYGYALEPGDLVRITDVANGFDNGEVWKVVETSHGANYINEISAEAILKCAIEYEGDALFTSVVLLLHAESSSPLLDSSAYDEGVSFMGDAQIDTTIKKFGTMSFAFDGTSDGVQAGGNFGVSPQYNFSSTNTSPYTIELWVRFTTLPSSAGNQILISRTSFAQNGWALFCPTSTNNLTYLTSSDGSTWTATVPASADLAAGVWQHIAVDKDSTGKVRIYVDGVMKASATPADSVIHASLAYPIILGCDAAGASGFAGNIDDVRITALSRYGDLYGDAGFDVPTEQFPDNAP